MTSKTYLCTVPAYSDIETAELTAQKPNKRKEHKAPIPQRKFCASCKVRRVKHHHYLCDECWEEIHNVKKEEEIVEF